MRSRVGPQRSRRIRARPSSTSQVPLGSTELATSARPPAELVMTTAIRVRRITRTTIFISDTFRFSGCGMRASVQLRQEGVGALVDAGGGRGERADAGLDVVGVGVLLGDVGTEQPRARRVEDLDAVDDRAGQHAFAVARGLHAVVD